MTPSSSAPDFELRPVESTDAAALERILQSAALRDRLYPLASPSIGLSDAVADWLEDRADKFAMICRLREGGEAAGLVRIDGWQVAFAVREGSRDRGLATAMVHRLLSEHVGPGRLEARVERRNVASQRVLQKTGFRFNGVENPPAGPARLMYVRER